jgi:two-component system phosphate regulon sensor histidine kinase PhoR
VRLLRSPRLRAGLAALVLTVVVVGALGAWQVSADRGSQRTQIIDGELTAARLASSAVESGMLSRLQLVTNLADQGITKQISDNSPAQLQQLASTVRALYPEFTSLAVDSADGRLLAVSPPGLSPVGADVAGKPAFAEAVKSGKPYVSPAFSLTGVGLVVALGAPFFSGNNTLAGVIVCTIPVNNFGSIIGSTALQSGGSIVVVDQKGTALTGPGTRSGDVYKKSAAVADALRGKEGTGQESLPGFSGSRLVAYSPVGDLGWAVVVQQPMSSLDNPIATLTLHLALIDLLVVLIAVVTAVLLARLLGQLAKERDEASAVLASVGEGVAIVDQAGKVVRLNPALEKLSGHTGESARDLPWTEAFPFTDERNQELAWSDSVVARAMSERRVVASHGFSRMLLAVNGTTIPVAVTAAPLTTADGQVNGAVAVIRDMSREHEVDELKSSLVSTVSHELRTPLTMIRGFSELLLSRSDLDATRSKKALEHINDSSQRLGRLIDDLLSVSRIESGGLSTALSAVEMSGVLEEVLVSFISNGAERVSTELPDGLPKVLADPDQLYQVLLNLVSNALKYSPADAPVRISARVVPGQVHVSVTDRGIGMTPSEVAQVFGKFARVDRPEVREVGGTGLGLYITRRLVDMMGGSIWVRSKAGEGSVFTFSIRLAPPEHTNGSRKENEQVYAQAADR